MEYKKIYSEEEIDEILNWAKSHMNRLPETLQLSPAFFIPDLHQTMEAYIIVTEHHRNNATYGAQIHHLFLIRDKLINENLLLPE